MTRHHQEEREPFKVSSNGSLSKSAFAASFSTLAISKGFSSKGVLGPYMSAGMLQAKFDLQVQLDFAEVAQTPTCTRACFKHEQTTTRRNFSSKLSLGQRSLTAFCRVSRYRVSYSTRSGVSTNLLLLQIIRITSQQTGAINLTEAYLLWHAFATREPYMCTMRCSASAGACTHRR